MDLKLLFIFLLPRDVLAHLNELYDTLAKGLTAPAAKKMRLGEMLGRCFLSASRFGQINEPDSSLCGDEMY